MKFSKLPNKEPEKRAGKAILKISILWPKIILKISKNDQIDFNTLYFLGGATNELNAADTAINPAYRTCTYQIETFTDAARDYLAETLPNSANFGSGLNHASRTEPDWENSFWGSNLQSLKDIKAIVDPDSRFNCWHCIGWNSPT